ncbi:MAG: hypothetical protein CXX81_28610 [Methanobacteriota archaeon]|nr:MAG: hypothetical protein CXX81_28610 [Euryarchaeota archaeon]
MRVLVVGAGGIGSQLLDLLIPALTAGDIASRIGGVPILHTKDTTQEWLGASKLIPLRSD